MAKYGTRRVVQYVLLVYNTTSDLRIQPKSLPVTFGTYLHVGTPAEMRSFSLRQSRGSVGRDHHHLHFLPRYNLLVIYVLNFHREKILLMRFMTEELKKRNKYIFFIYIFLTNIEIYRVIKYILYKISYLFMAMNVDEKYPYSRRKIRKLCIFHPKYYLYSIIILSCALRSNVTLT